MDKKSIRQMMKEKRLLLNQETFSLYNQSIYHQVIHHPYYQSAKLIACYVSLQYEVDTISLIKKTLETHRVCVPKVHGDIMHFYEIESLDDLKEGCFHVLEPITTKQIQLQDIDLMIVPLLAFDQFKYRVGYGKGYYDKYFASGYQGYKLGLAFSFQYVNCIDIDQYDYCLDEIIVENILE